MLLNHVVPFRLLCLPDSPVDLYQAAWLQQHASYRSRPVVQLSIDFRLHLASNHAEQKQQSHSSPCRTCLLLIVDIHANRLWCFGSCAPPDVTMPSSFYVLMGIAPTGFDPEHRFVTSWLLTPLWLANYRAAFALFGWADLISSWVWDGINDPGQIGPQFSYFTNLTWWGITCYMSIAAIHTFVYSKKGYTWLDRWWRPLQVLHTLFYTTVVVFPFIVTIVYWAVLFDGPWFSVTMDAFRNVSSCTCLSPILTPSRFRNMA